VGLPRRDLFGEQSSGDVDVLAGPLWLTIGRREFDLLLDDARREMPGAPLGWLNNAVMRRAGREGLVQWPPNIRYTAAIEVKSSYFDGQVWKATHVDEEEKVRGSLKKRQQMGVNAVAFMHLGVVVPTQSVDEMDRMFATAVRQFPAVLDDRDLHGAGYFVRAMIGMEKMGKMVWGGEGGPGWIEQPRPKALARQRWHDSLRDRLAQMPRPDFARTFIHGCRDCGQWRHAASADPQGYVCPCHSS
jgi:hypothetical protein